MTVIREAFRGMGRLLAPAAVLAAGAAFGGQSVAEEIAVDAWLVLGPAPAFLPAFHDGEAGDYSLEDLLEARAIRRPDLRPRAGGEVSWEPGGAQRWAEVEAGPGGAVDLEPGPGIQVAYLATYLRLERFASLKLEARSHHLIQVDVDGAKVATRSDSTGEDEAETEPVDPGKASADLDLDPGVHRLLVKAVRDPGCPYPWAVEVSLTPPEDLPAPGLTFATSPRHPLELAQILEAPRPVDVAVSPDGTLAAITLRRIIPGTDEGESWVEIVRTGDGSTERTYRGSSLSSVAWEPRGRRLSYVTRDEDQATLWVADLEAGTVHPLLERVEHLGSYRWAPDGRSLIYSVSIPPEKDETGIQRLWGLQDRQKGWRKRSYLHQVSVPGGTRRRLTAGELTTDLADISPEGSRVAFTRTVDDYERRPFLRDELYLLDLRTLDAERVYPGHWLGGVSWSPDGRRLLVRAGPSAFGGAGAVVPEGTVPNDYDDQLYLMEPRGRVEPLSLEFHPSVNRAVWHRNGSIYLVATDGSRRSLFRLDPEARAYAPVETGLEVVGDLAVARDAPVAVVIGSGASMSPRVHVVDLEGETHRELRVPGAEAFQDVELGKVEPWSFESRRGVSIQGRVYYPPDFDASRRYPGIIYYYGGTAPTVRDFGGRYPKNWWAGHGYVVYVLQPSGAIGYGQEFSALHVNDWGRIAGDDILEGVERFLEAHPFVDPERLGCIGASYGGFMTQYLLTRTDRFAAGVSHAGISFLGSYWGEGYWGYAYSSVASAESFPWNRGDLYVGHSPLFNADRIRTPLLLLHGTADTNVPPGESEQLYTALKLLGQPVEYVRIAGQDHHILQHDQRLLWSRTILAWFDRWLKDAPEWWDHLYPGPGGSEEEDG